ncbi:hypothetical protein [Ammoniphilus sp. YIM 78166]|uniref:hypothetical protein n=1 Tax=Ammoniphilus sp. YIM 78166 TaxID=1644106 RepID=UPI001430A696|nr:hypothetical protein [Ammoniphilus sp. YIM 78166]
MENLYNKQKYTKPQINHHQPVRFETAISQCKPPSVIATIFGTNKNICVHQNGTWDWLK